MLDRTSTPGNPPAGKGGRCPAFLIIYFYIGITQTGMTQMALKHREMRHKKTGEHIYVPSGRYGNYSLAIRKLVQYVRYNMPRYYIVHLVLTLAEASESVSYRELNRVMSFIRRRMEKQGAQFKYIAVKEIQKEREKKYGERALHWHILCFYDTPYAFPRWQDIQKSWKLGWVRLRAPKLPLKIGRIASYIGKYIGKGYEFETLEQAKSFTASQIPSVYKMRSERVAEVINRWGVYSARTFKCTFRKVIHQLKYMGEIFKERILFEWPSEWEDCGVIEGSPF
jgi:hypothetical protein